MAFNGHVGHIGGIESPWFNAGGVVKTIDDVYKMALTGVGAEENGSYTLEERLGNAWDPVTQQYSKVIYTHDPVTGITTNSLGMPNKGFDIVEQELPEMKRIANTAGKPLIVNVAPVSESPVEETRELVSRAYDQDVDAVLVNGGCPNVVVEDGGRHELLSRNPDMLRLVLAGLETVVEKHKPIFLRVSPLREHGLAEIAEIIKNSRVVSAVFTPNTWPGHVPKNKKGQPILDVPGGAGGASGPYYKDKALVETSLWVEALKGTNIDVVSSSSIMNAEELKRRLYVGAAACAGTTFFYEANTSWQQAVDKLLSEYAA